MKGKRKSQTVTIKVKVPKGKSLSRTLAQLFRSDRRKGAK